MLSSRLSHCPTDMTAQDPEPDRGFPSIFRKHGLAFAFLATLWILLCRHLSAEWSINEQYTYGWFVPFFALYLLWVRWASRPDPLSPPAKTRIIVGLAAALPALLLLLPVRLFEVGNPDWRVLGWLHAFAVVAMTFFLVWCTGGRPWARHFAFPIAFFFVAVPWILTVETPAVQGLMRVVAMCAAEAVTLFGIPVQVEGSLIRVSNGVVGVNEACSGVRSFQTSLMIGLLLGELKMLSVRRRVILVVGALAIALLANFARTLFLVWVAATENIGAVDRWHDAAGYTILGVVFVGSLLLAKFLARRVPGETSLVASTDGPATLPRAAAARFSSTAIAVALAWILLVEVGVEAWYRYHEHNLTPQKQWTVRWPDPADGARPIPIDERVKRTLRYDDGGEMSFPIAAPHSPDNSASRAFLFFFRWKPGTASVLRARGHRPEYCLPNAGWTLMGDHGTRTYKAGSDFTLPFQHVGYARTDNDRPVGFAHTFFCIYEDRVPVDRANKSALPPNVFVAERADGFVRVVRAGLRNPGQQVMELVVTSLHEIPPAEAEARFSEMLPSLVRIEGESETAPTPR